LSLDFEVVVSCIRNFSKSYNEYYEKILNEEDVLIKKVDEPLSSAETKRWVEHSTHLFYLSKADTF